MTELIMIKSIAILSTDWYIPFLYSRNALDFIRSILFFLKRGNVNERNHHNSDK